VALGRFGRCRHHGFCRAIPLSAVVCLTVVPPWLRRWESKLGNLSYGIYLNHFMVAGLLLWLMEAIGHEVFGFYASAGFGISLAIASSLVAALTFISWSILWNCCAGN
jgi:peptidoglycan/LPS O-acetylase OafA/YrhL